MNIIRNFLLFIKNIFVKPNDTKKLMAPNSVVKDSIIATKTNTLTNTKLDFINSLKVTTIKKDTNKKIITLTCKGDGLGIRKKLDF